MSKNETTKTELNKMSEMERKEGGGSRVGEDFDVAEKESDSRQDSSRVVDDFDARQKRKKEQAAKKKWKKPLLVGLFILLNVLVIGLTAGAEFGNSTEAEELANVKIDAWYLIPATLCFMVAITFEIHKYVLMIREMTVGKFNRRKARKIARRTVLLGKYYDNVTPAAIGGQPFEIYYMHKNSDLPAGAATAIPIFGMVAGQIGFMLIAIPCFLIGSFTIHNAALIGAACFGLLFYAFWPIAILIAVFLPKGMTELVGIFVKLFAKLKLVKDEERTRKKVEYEINENAKSVKMILKKPGLFTRTILCAIMFNGLVATIPFFVLTAFGGRVDFLPCFVTTVAVTSAVYFVPTPGNAGAAEGTFFLVFSALSSGYVFWAMLTWRFFSYYVYILTGPIIYAKMHFEGKKKKNV